MNYYIYGYTSKGNIRSINEDRILVDGKIRSEGSRYSTVSAPFITAVCDGVGGEKAGELAAQTCLEELAKVCYRSDVDMKSTVNDIHLKVRKCGVIGQGTLNMQTTLCALAVDEKGDAMCINVGDSRMYRYINAAIRQISTDQSYSQYVYEHGSDEQVAQIDPKLQNAIVSSVGSLSNDPQIELVPLVTKFGNEPDDMILIVSDGITDYVSEQQLEIGMGLDLPIGQKLEAIAQLAIDNGSEDNISIIGIKPYITKHELEAITSQQKGETVNIQKLIAETYELGDILTFDINEIISQPYVKPQEPEYVRKPAAKKPAPVEVQKTAEKQEQEPLEGKKEEPAATVKPTVQAEPIEEKQESRAVAEQKTEPVAEIKPTVQAEPIEDKQEQEQNPEINEQAELADNGSNTKEAVMEVENSVQTAEQDTETNDIDERELPDELVHTQDIAGEFREKFSQIKQSTSEDGAAAPSESTGEKKQLDFSFHTVELSHQSASSLARLEKLFGKK